MKLRILFPLLVLLLPACASFPPTADAPLSLKKVDFKKLSGWQSDNHAAALVAFSKSCPRILKADPARGFGPNGVGGTYAGWQEACAALSTSTDARAFFETYFTPYEARAGSSRDGLFTGYYEASLRGSLTRHGPYQYPLRLKPADLVMVDLGLFRDELKGQRIAGRVKDGHLKPFEDRAKIVAGALPDDEKISFVYVDDPVDSFFLQIQGSGVVTLDDGRSIRVGYDGQNGWPYYAIGRELVKRGALKKEDVSMDSIRGWLAANPGEAESVMNTNKSYVFFRILDTDGPVGGEGVVLTSGRSLAVDRTRIPYGVPVWLETEKENSPPGALKRLMVAQDTGGAIIGSVRGDVFFGYGPEAEDLAGGMKARGRYWLLLPKAAASAPAP